jgi:hypothetical protein
MAIITINSMVRDLNTIFNMVLYHITNCDFILNDNDSTTYHIRALQLMKGAR